MNIREALTNLADSVFAAPYIYIGGPIFGAVRVVIGSRPVNLLRAAVRPDLKKFDFGTTFRDRYLTGYRSVRDAFTYRPPKESEVCLGDRI